MKHQLIIIEGLTGSGKSTLAHFIKRQLDFNRIANVWVHEGEAPHPIFLEQDIPIQDFLKVMPCRWQGFLDDCRAARKVAVVEACFFNNLIETPFLENIDRQTLLEFGRQMEDIIRLYAPALIYLKKEDIPAALAQNFENRGEGFRDFVMDFVLNTPYAQARNFTIYDDMVQFWVDCWAILDEIYTCYTIDKLAIENSTGDWVRYNQEVLDFLGLPCRLDPILSKLQSQKYCGEYAIEGKNETWRIWYSDTHTCLMLNRTLMLIPTADNRFLVSSLHFEVVFEENRSGDITSFRIEGQDIDYLKLVGTTGYRK